MRHARLIYKIASPEVMAESRRRQRFAGMAVDHADGYLHFSTAEQLPETLRLHFRGRRGLALLALDPAAMNDALRWEASRGGGLFPHLYGTFAMADVLHQATISVDEDGNCDLPEWVR